MTIGFFSPLPPAKSGIADYSEALLEALRKLGRVEINDSSADTLLYHIGNNQLHREIYRQALERPGVAVLHDAVLQHFFLGSLTEAEYISEFVYNYGEWHRELAHRLWQGRAGSASDPRYFRYPMVKRIAERSKAVVVHNPGAAAIVAAHAPGARVVEIPHLFRAPEGESAPRSEKFRFGVFGHLRESKRLPSVLRAFESVEPAELLIAGEFASTDLARAVQPLMEKPGVTRIGYLAEADFWRYARSVDACINLRYPAAGETSGIAIRMMGLGKPVILTAGLEVSRFPESICLRTDSGTGEAAMLAEYMRWLVANPEQAREIGRRAAAYIAEHHALDAVAAQYWRVLSL